MTNFSGEFTVSAIGAPVLDVYRNEGLVTDPAEIGMDYEVGDKLTLPAGIILARAQKLRQEGAQVRIGGNATNTAAYVAMHGGEVSYVSVVGQDLEVSTEITDHLEGRLGMSTKLVAHVPGYQPRVAIVERDGNGERTIFGMPLEPMDAHISDETLEVATRGDLVIVASLKSPDLNGRVFEAVGKRGDNRPALSFCPGSAEYKDPDALVRLTSEVSPDLWALNTAEAATVLGVDRPPKDDIRAAREIAERMSASGLAENILCTGGVKVGNFWAANGKVTHGESRPVRAIDDLGAGDRGHGAAVVGLMQGQSGAEILASVSYGTAQVVQAIGGHHDLLVS